MYHLFIGLSLYSVALIPDPYISLDACNKAELDANIAFYRCIEVSKDDYCKYHYLTTAIGNQAITQKVCDEY